MRINYVGDETKIFESLDRFALDLKISPCEMYMNISLFKLCFPPSYKDIHTHIQDYVGRSPQLTPYKVFSS